ncbi:MAG: PAS domain S-box protein, partial [Leptolyngbya sp. DLM2.Bin27]
MANSNCPPPSQALTYSRHTVLVIDRAPTSADAYRRLLQQQSDLAYQVLAESEDGPIAELCHSRSVDSILLEAHAPDPRGLELTRQLASQMGDRCPPIIVVDANDAYLAVAALKAGAADYLVRDHITADRLHRALSAAAPRLSDLSDLTAYLRPRDREWFLAVGSDLQAIAGQAGYFHWVSPTFERLLGWTTAEITSRPWIEFIHPDDLARSVAMAERLLSSNDVLAFENRYRHRDGTYRWLRWRCQMDSAQQVSYGTAVDITALKQSEAALDKSHDQLEQQAHIYDAMLSTISDFVYLFDRDGRFIFANQPLLDLWGIPLADAVGKNFVDLNYPDVLAAKLKQQIERVFNTAQTVRDETPYTSPTGVSGIYEYIFAPLLGPDGSVQSVVGSTRNVTQHRQIEATLQENEARLRLITETVPQIIWITDAAGNVEFINRQWQDYTGDPTESTSALKALIRFVHPEDVALTMAAFNQALESGSSFRTEHRIRSAAGTYRWFLAQAEPYRDLHQGHITRWFGTLVDVHDLKLAEAALRSSEAKYRSLFNSMDEGFCILQVVFDAADRAIDYRYLEVNPVFERQTGLSNVLGKTIRELVSDLEPFWFDIYGR